MERLFEIQRKIDAVLSPRYGGLDQSYAIPWRNNACWNDEDNVYSFAFSAFGEYEGELPPDCAQQIIEILQFYKT